MDETRRLVAFLLHRARDRPLALNHLNYPSNWYLAQIETDILLMGVDMAAKSRKTVPNFNGAFQTVFVDVRLAQQDKVQFEQFMQQGDDELGLLLAEFVSNGNKFSLTWDNDNSCFIASATCRDEGSVNLNHCISSRSQDWFEAVMLTVFKATVMLVDKAWSEVTSDRSWG